MQRLKTGNDYCIGRWVINMFKKVVFTTSTIALISGVALTVNLLAEPSKNDVPSSLKSSAKELLANHNDSVDPKLSTSKNTEWDPDISPEVDFDKLRYISLISTKHGDFVRQDKQIIFNESEIARQLRQVGQNTKQLILNYGIFLRTDIK